jgi:hypothetical protein
MRRKKELSQTVKSSMSGIVTDISKLEAFRLKRKHANYRLSQSTGLGYVSVILTENWFQKF